MTARPPSQSPTGRFVPTCTELFVHAKSPRLSNDVQFSRFHGLDRQRHDLVLDWHKRGCRSTDPFERFLYSWVAYNGWASCIADRTSDTEINGALGHNREAIEAFSQLLSDPAFNGAAATFAEYWPIFAVKDVRGHGPFDELTRKELIDHYLAKNRNDFHPKCWTVHRDAGTPVPCDWPHTLAALYRVRNNLFHGDKEPNSLSDQTIVAAAGAVLSACLDAFTTIQHP